MMYIIPFISSFLVTSGILILFVFLCSKFDFLKIISKNTKNREKICRLGGVAIIIGFISSLFIIEDLVISQKLWGIIFASLIIFIFGILDDFFDFEWKIQLFFQVSIAIFVFIFGVRADYLTNPLGGFVFLNIGKYLIPSLVFVVFWIVLLINSMNWIDGIDGLSGGISLVGSLSIFLLSLKPEVNQPPVAIISIALSGAFLGFLLFNFNPSKIMAGTSGSMFMGFILATLAIFAGTKIATALLIGTIPVINAIWVIGERIKFEDSIFKADKRHLHHKLLELGWSQRKIVAFLLGITSLVAIVALNTRAIGKIITLIMVFIIMISTFVFINKKLYAKKLKLKSNE